MALETVFFPQDPFSYVGKDLYCWGSDYLQENNEFSLISDNNIITSTKSLSGNLNQSCSTSEVIIGNMNDELLWDHNNNYSRYSGAAHQVVAGEVSPAAGLMVTAGSKKKRQRTKSCKNKEDLENQRMTHIAVERNRRKQMNEYLAVIKALMPTSYAQRGDQASIIGGAINFVKELEQQLQTLEAKKKNVKGHSKNGSNNVSPLFSNIFTFPQYSMHSSTESRTSSENDDSTAPEIHSVAAALGDIEVTMAESHANIKILTKKRPKQLLKIIVGLQRMWLTILHVNLTTTFDQMVLYTISIKIEEGCQLNTVPDLADEVNHILAKIEAAV